MNYKRKDFNLDIIEFDSKLSLSALNEPIIDFKGLININTPLYVKDVLEVKLEADKIMSKLNVITNNKKEPIFDLEGSNSLLDITLSNYYKNPLEIEIKANKLSDNLSEIPPLLNLDLNSLFDKVFNVKKYQQKDNITLKPKRQLPHLRVKRLNWGGSSLVYESSQISFNKIFGYFQRDFKKRLKPYTQDNRSAYKINMTLLKRNPFTKVELNTYEDKNDIIPLLRRQFRRTVKKQVFDINKRRSLRTHDAFNDYATFDNFDTWLDSIFNINKIVTIFANAEELAKDFIGEAWDVYSEETFNLAHYELGYNLTKEEIDALPDFDYDGKERAEKLIQKRADEKRPEDEGIFWSEDQDDGKLLEEIWDDLQSDEWDDDWY